MHTAAPHRAIRSRINTTYVYGRVGIISNFLVPPPTTTAIISFGPGCRVAGNYIGEKNNKYTFVPMYIIQWGTDEGGPTAEVEFDENTRSHKHRSDFQPQYIKLDGGGKN